MSHGVRTAPLRVVIIDDHSVYRAACRALLRTEGVDVLADVAADKDALRTVQAFEPDLILVDISPGRGSDIARRLTALANVPSIVLTSSAERTRFGTELDSMPFIAKADVCSETLASAADHGQPSVRFGLALGTRRLLEGAASGGAFALIEHDLPPRQLGSPIHTHTREDEHSYVLCGQLTVLLAGELVEAGPGDVVHKPRGIPHAFWNAEEETVRFLELIAPAGFDQYFFDVAAQINKHDRAAAAAIAASYGLDIQPDSIPALIERYRLDPPI